jgi:hypothetical protein
MDALRLTAFVALACRPVVGLLGVAVSAGPALVETLISTTSRSGHDVVNGGVPWVQLFGAVVAHGYLVHGALLSAPVWLL